jgi:hypothetical protein
VVIALLIFGGSTYTYLDARAYSYTNTKVVNISEYKPVKTDKDELVALSPEVLASYTSTEETITESKPTSVTTEEIKETNIETNSSPEPRSERQEVLTNKKPKVENSDIFTVPFYSQFKDITSDSWKKVGCGIASLAMIIEFYEPGEVKVDTLLKEGISAGAYLDDAGWTHGGLIGLSKKYGLGGESHDLRDSTMESAFSRLKTVLEDGPVMASVHYTFDPKNPIPHLVVVNGVSDGMVYYNDPAEKVGGNSITVAQFKSAWKKRYIEIHPV